jgi:hypothetical protein
MLEYGKFSIKFGSIHLVEYFGAIMKVQKAYIKIRNSYAQILYGKRK